MFSFLVFAVLCISSLANAETYDSSATVGGQSGTSFSTSDLKCITGLRLWEIPNSYVSGLQLRHNDVWGDAFGFTTGTSQEILLYEGENIVQVSGKHGDYINFLEFVTSEGRSLIAGQPSQNSFNFYPETADQVLMLLSGNVDSSVSAMSGFTAKWGTPTSGDCT